MKRTCEHYEALLLDYAYEELEPAARREVATHLAGCASCAESLEQLTGTRRIMAALPEEPPERGDDFILQAAAREARLRAESDEGRLRRLGRWLLSNPLAGTAAVGGLAAAVLVLMTVTGNVGDLMEASADALAGQEPPSAASRSGYGHRNLKSFGSAPGAAAPAREAAPAYEAPADEAVAEAEREVADRLVAEPRRKVTRADAKPEAKAEPARSGRSPGASRERRARSRAPVWGGGGLSEDQAQPGEAHAPRTESVAREQAPAAQVPAGGASAGAAVTEGQATAGAAFATGAAEVGEGGGGADQDERAAGSRRVPLARKRKMAAERARAAGPGRTHAAPATSAPTSLDAPVPADAPAPAEAAPPSRPRPVPNAGLGAELRPPPADAEGQAAPSGDTSPAAARAAPPAARSERDFSDTAVGGTLSDDEGSAAEAEATPRRRSADGVTGGERTEMLALTAEAARGAADKAEAARGAAEKAEAARGAAEKAEAAKDAEQDGAGGAARLLDRGLGLAAAGRCAEAVDLLDRALLGLQNRRDEAHLARGRCLVRLGRTDDARDAFAHAAAQGGRSPAARKAHRMLDALDSVDAEAAAPAEATQPAEPAGIGP